MVCYILYGTYRNKTTTVKETMIDSAFLLDTALCTLLLLGPIDCYVYEEYATVTMNTEPVG